jgi:hypothetical protein
MYPPIEINNNVKSDKKNGFLPLNLDLAILNFSFKPLDIPRL